MKGKIIKLLFAFIMTLLFLVLFISIGLGIGVFNSRSVIKGIDQSDYYSKAYNAINQKAERLLSEASLNEELLSDLITAGRVHVDGMNYVNAILNNKSQHISDIYQDVVSHITNDLYIQSDDSLNNNNSIGSNDWLTNMSIESDDLSARIHELATAIEYEYKSEVELRFVDYLMIYKADYIKIMIILIPCTLLLIFFLTYLLIRMHKYRHRGIRYIAYAIIASSVLIIITASYWLLSKKYIDPTIVPDYYNQFISSYIKMGITVYVYIGILGIIIALALITLIGHMRNKILYKK